MKIEQLIRVQIYPLHFDSGLMAIRWEMSVTQMCFDDYAFTYVYAVLWLTLLYNVRNGDSVSYLKQKQSRTIDKQSLTNTFETIPTAGGDVFLRISIVRLEPEEIGGLQ